MLIADYLHVHHESHQNILYNSFKKKYKKIMSCVCLLHWNTMYVPVCEI